MEIVMKTFYGDDGNYAEIPLSKILDRMTDDWIDDEVTGENISELRDACRKLLETAHNSDYTKCLNELWRHIQKNAKNGSFIKSSIAEILKKHSE